MDYVSCCKRINMYFVLLLLTISFFPFPGWALEPTITDVTTRSFSVIWTESSAVSPTDCTLNVYKNGVLVNSPDFQIIKPGDDLDALLGLARGVVKFEVIGLSYNTTYTCQGTRLGGSALFSSGPKSVTTENFIGLAEGITDPSANDIVTNDIVHVTVYNYRSDEVEEKPKSKEGALGALVMAGIYKDAACTDPNRLSDYPITGWVGSGMPGDKTDLNYSNKVFNKDNVCYKEFAALNFNNLFGKDKFPLQLKGDTATTATIEGEYVKITVIPGITRVLVPGITSVAGEQTFTMPMPEITKVANQKISSAKVTSKIVFKSGMNLFTYPYAIPEGYSAKMLVDAIRAAGGSVSAIKRHNGGTSWTVASVNPAGAVTNNYELKLGVGYLVIIGSTLPQNFYISNSPLSTLITLKANLNVVNFTQIPTFYTMGDLARSILKAGGQVTAVKRHNGGTSWTVASVAPTGAVNPADAANTLIERGKAYLVVMKSTQTDITINPLLTQ